MVSWPLLGAIARMASRSGGEPQRPSKHYASKGGALATKTSADFHWAAIPTSLLVTAAPHPVRTAAHEGVTGVMRLAAARCR